MGSNGCTSASCCKSIIGAVSIQKAKYFGTFSVFKKIWPLIPNKRQYFYRYIICFKNWTFGNLFAFYFFQLKMMDCDIERRRTRSGRMATQLVLLPDADISEPENDSDSDYEQVHSDAESEHSSSNDEDDVPLVHLLRA